MVFLPTIYPPFLLIRWSGSGRSRLTQHLRRFIPRAAWRHVHRVCATVIARRCCCHCTTTGQVVRHGSNSSSGAEGRFRCTHDISDASVQLLSTGCVPASFKDSFVTPILKKSGLDDASPSSYRPISYLSVISKMLERLELCASVCDVP